MSASKYILSVVLVVLLVATVSECQDIASVDTPSQVREMRGVVSTMIAKMEEYRKSMMSELGNMAKNFPNVSSIPDKLVRAELSMLQDEIRMAQEMLNNPLSATLNTPQNLANMFSKMGNELAH